MRVPLPSSTLLRVIATQNEIAAGPLLLDDVMGLVCARAAELTGASGAALEMVEHGATVCRARSGTAAAADVVAVPVIQGSRPVGTLKAFSDRPRRFTGAALEVLRLLSDILVAHLEGAGRNQAVAPASRRDPLTGLGNRRHYEQRLAREVSAAARAGRTLSLCLLDLHGAPAGGEEVCAVARILQGLRESDDAFRIGDFEFAVLLPGTSLLGGRVVAERLTDRIAAIGEGQLAAVYGVADMTDPNPGSLHAAAEAQLAARRRAPLVAA